jgi:hypothetical protein
MKQNKTMRHFQSLFKICTQQGPDSRGQNVVAETKQAVVDGCEVGLTMVRQTQNSPCVQYSLLALLLQECPAPPVLSLLLALLL